MGADGDREYIEYVTARAPTLQRTAYLLSGDVHRGADLVQTVLTSLYTRWQRVRRVENIDAYVRKMLVHAFLNEKRRPWYRISLLADVPDERQTVEPRPEDRAVLVAALAQLPQRQRAVLVLRFLWDLPVGEVAEILSCPEGTVKSQTSRGLATLREVLGPPALAALKGEN